MYAQRVQLKTTIDGQQVPLNPYTDCVKNVRQQMPLAGSKLLGTTVLYVGPTTDTYSTGVCYTCKATESSSYYWEKVQPNSDTIGHNIFDIFYSMSSKAPAGAMDLSLGTLIASCDTVFPDFWRECLQRRGNIYMFPQFSGQSYYHWSGDNVLGSEGLNAHGNAICYYNSKIYVLAHGECGGHETPPSQSQEWRQFIVPTEQWVAQRQYSIGDTVLYNGQIWCARPKSQLDDYWTGVGITPGTIDADGRHHWALYDLPTQIVAPSIRILTESEWQAEATANGSCGAFVVDEDAKSVRLPKITSMIQPGDVGVFTEAGLPNITGSLSDVSLLTGNGGAGGNIDGATFGSGALTADGHGHYWNKSGTDNRSYITFKLDASKSNSIYGNSTTVQPPAVGAKLYIQVFTSAVPASMAQAVEFINMLESYLPLSGGTMTGNVFWNSETGFGVRHKGTNVDVGWSFDDRTGSGIGFRAVDYTGSNPGGFSLFARNDTTGAALDGYADGTLTWGGHSVLNPTGTVIAFAGNSAPAGYLICNGAAVSRTTYSKLFAVIGTTYGAGDDSTTFNLPNLTDKFIMGSGTAGTSKAAGVPDIRAMFVPIPIKNSSSGNVGSIIISYSGALTMSHETDISLTGFQISPVTLSSSLYRYTFAASSYNSIYGNSSTVQPPALTMRFYIKY